MNTTDALTEILRAPLRPLPEECMASCEGNPACETGTCGCSHCGEAFVDSQEQSAPPPWARPVENVWTRTPSVRGAWSCLQEYIYEIRPEDARALFGRPTKSEAYVDEEAGYAGEDWFFSRADGEFAHLYSRWGQLRIGSHNAEVAAEFHAWLRAQILSFVPVVGAP